MRLSLLSQTLLYRLCELITPKQQLVVFQLSRNGGSSRSKPVSELQHQSVTRAGSQLALLCLGVDAAAHSAQNGGSRKLWPAATAASDTVGCGGSGKGDAWGFSTDPTESFKAS